MEGCVNIHNNMEGLVNIYLIMEGCVNIHNNMEGGFGKYIPYYGGLREYSH